MTKSGLMAAIKGEIYCWGITYIYCTSDNNVMTEDMKIIEFTLKEYNRNNQLIVFAIADFESVTTMILNQGCS